MDQTTAEAQVIRWKVMAIFTKQNASPTTLKFAKRVSDNLALAILESDKEWPHDPDQVKKINLDFLAKSWLRLEVAHIDREYQRYCQAWPWFVVLLAKVLMWKHWQAVQEFKRIVEGL
jgi:hypothetical protein